MNTDEVVATLAAERLGRPVHPNDHGNASQSSNDAATDALPEVAQQRGDQRGRLSAGVYQHHLPGRCGW